LSQVRLTWCEQTVIVLVLLWVLSFGKDMLTLVYWKAYGLDILKDIAIAWLILRVIDMIYCLPQRRAAKRHLDELEKQKFGKYWKPR